MVSSRMEVGLEGLLETLDRLRRECADDPEYQRLRRQLPADWPM